MKNLIDKKCAPVLIYVYNRADNFAKCIAALSSCKLSYMTDVYIASDGAKNENDQASVSKIRNIASSYNEHFKSLTVFKREENLGAEKNKKLAHDYVLKSFDSIITLEDDVEMGIDCLQFLNHYLVNLANNESIVGVCSYLPYDASHVEKTAMLLPFRSPYAFAKWKHKEHLLNDTQEKNLNYFRVWRHFVAYLNRRPHNMFVLPLILNGDWKVAHDVNIGLVMHRKKLSCVYPPSSLSRNNGFNKSGLNASIKDKFKQQAVLQRLQETALYPEKLILSEKVVASLAKLHQKPIRYIFILPVYFAINNKLIYCIYKMAYLRYRIWKRLRC